MCVTLLRRPLDAEQQVETKIKHNFAHGRGTYGTRQIKALLAQEGFKVSRRRIGSVLSQAGLVYAAQHGADSKRPRPQGNPRLWL